MCHVQSYLPLQPDQPFHGLLSDSISDIKQWLTQYFPHLIETKRGCIMTLEYLGIFFLCSLPLLLETWVSSLTVIRILMN